MSIGSVNSPLSLQESQLLQILQQQSAMRAKAKSAGDQAETGDAKSGQNLPGGTDVRADTAAQNLDPNLSPEKISALLLALQTQQASLDTTLLLGGSSAGPGGKTLVDYLTANNNVANPLMDDGATEDDGGGENTGELSLVDYLS